MLISSKNKDKKNKSKITIKIKIDFYRKYTNIKFIFYTTFKNIVKFHILEISPKLYCLHTIFKITHIQIIKQKINQYHGMNFTEDKKLIGCFIP